MIKLLHEISYTIRITLVLLSIVMTLILFVAKTCHYKLNSVNYTVRSLDRDQYQTLIKWRSIIIWQANTLILVLCVIDQLFIESITNSTYAWALNPVIKVFTEFSCYILKRNLGQLATAKILYFYYVALASVVIFFTSFYGWVFLSHVFTF